MEGLRTRLEAKISSWPRRQGGRAAVLRVGGSSREHFLEGNTVPEEDGRRGSAGSDEGHGMKVMAGAGERKTDLRTLEGIRLSALGEDSGVRREAERGSWEGS